MAKIILYTKESFPYCRLAKELLNARKLAFEEIRIDLDEAKREEMVRLSNRRTVPPNFINCQTNGGYDDFF